MMNASTPILDRSIKATADNAMVAKLATTQAGYYEDPFLDAFSRSPDDNSYRRVMGSLRTGRGQARNNSRTRMVQPIIKRGTHARVCVMDRVISCFLRMNPELPTNDECQVVVLGAGKDTSYFRCRSGTLLGDEDRKDEGQGQRGEKAGQQKNMKTRNKSKIHWFEVDHVSVIEEKALLIKSSNVLKSVCPQLVKTKSGYGSFGSSDGFKRSSEESQSSLSVSSTYHLVGHDLRDSPNILLEKLNLNPTLPTLFIMECVSMYIPITQSKNLLHAISKSADTVFIACYEPILGRGDPFGLVMERNLVKMGVANAESCLLQVRTLEQQLEKLIDGNDFFRAVGCDMSSAYETIVSEAQRRHANQSEFMDEYEEWILIMRHYCFVVAQGGRSFSQSSQSDLMKIVDQNKNNEVKSSSALGWVAGKCLELEKK